MGDDVGVVEVRGEHELDGDRAVACLALVLAGDGKRGDVGESTRVDVDRGGEEHLLAVEVEELDRAGDAEAQARARDLPPRDDAIEERDDRADPVSALEVAGGLALGDERGAVLGLLEDLATPPRARVPSRSDYSSARRNITVAPSQ